MQHPILNQAEIKDRYSFCLGGQSPFDIGIPLLDCEDKTIEEIYYYRWHVFCLHIRKTPEGHIISEFYNDVPWSGKYNAISCPAGHHMYEGRWLHNHTFLTDYANYWFKDEEATPRFYSFWAADAIYAMCKVWGNFDLAKDLYEKLKENYSQWEKGHLKDCGLFYQIDNYDGMEFSAGGSGLRPTINSYMYGDAKALSNIAKLLNNTEESVFYEKKAVDLGSKTNQMLWNREAEFFETLSEDCQSVNVRELVGYVPWCFNLPDESKSIAWKYLNDETYFYAPYGPTTAEQICPDYMKSYDHECLWNGPSWPFATSQTLTALGNLLCNYNQSVMKKTDYYKLLKLYANSQYDKDEKGNLIPYVDEDLDPYTGEWIARSILRSMENPPGGDNRGANYNHSTFCDLVISGLAGIRPRDDGMLEINPLFDKHDMRYFAMEGILYHGKSISIIWDREGTQYGIGKGLHIYCDGVEKCACEKLDKIEISL